jgi:signal transduction histidine kinase
VERTIVRRLSGWLAWTGVVIAVIGAPVNAVVAPDQPLRVAASLAAGGVGLLGLWLLGRGWIFLSARVLLWTFWGILALACAYNGGIGAPALTASLILAAFATQALGLRHGLVVCAATAALCIALLAHERTGHVPLAVAPELRALMHVMLGVMICCMLWATASMLRAAAAEALGEAARRAVAERAARASETALQALNATLEARVAERTALLETLNGELESFSYSVAHDLRAPLRAINGFSECLLRDAAPGLSGESRRDLERIVAAGRRMDGLIDDLLRLSRLNRSALVRDRFDLSALAQEVLATLRAGDRDRQVETAVEPGLAAEGDARLMRVLLENLIGNAWKYTARADPARIAIGHAMIDGASAFFVRDNGAGFDMAHAGRLFGAFQRMHPREEFEGHGIGLATAKRIVGRHGGRIWAEAAVGRGATFWFTLPSGDQPVAAASALA